MVKFDTDIADKSEFKTYAKDIAMQIAAANPQYLTSDQVPQDVLDKEKEILKQQAINEGKPDNIAEKIVQGRISKYFKDVCLLDQPFVKDNDLTISKYTQNTAKELGGKINIIDFVRIEKGEGIEKRSSNLADEVASIVK